AEAHPRETARGDGEARRRESLEHAADAPCPPATRRRRLASGAAVPAGDGSRLLDPGCHLLLVQLVRLAHVQGARVLLSADGRNGLERGPLEERELHMTLKGGEGEEPALPVDTVERAVPPDGLANAGHVLHDEFVDAPGDGGLPRLHARDVGPHALVPVGLGQHRGLAGLTGGRHAPYVDVLSSTAARISALNASASTCSPSWMSIARLTFPSRLELKSRAGSSNDAPLAKVNFTFAAYVSPVQMMPPCDHVGVPGFVAFAHFHSSTTSGSAALMSSRILP